MIQRVKIAWTGSGARSLYRAEKFLSLRARYELLEHSQNLEVPPTIAAIFARVPAMAAGTTGDVYLTQVRDAVTWADVGALEEALIDILPVAELPEQLMLQRLVYSQTVPADEYASYEHTMLNLATATYPLAVPFSERIRSELLAITQRIRYMLELSPPKEKARSTLTARTIGLMVFGIVVIVTLYVLSQTIAVKYNDNFVPTESLFAVLLAGLVGGFISVQQRLQTPTEVDPLYKWLELDASGTSLLLSPLIGMVFAVVFFGIIMAGFVTGPLFPKFVECNSVSSEAAVALHCLSHDFASFAIASTPDSAQSWAKLIIWAFAAGFLERLVPDILTRIAAVAEK